MRDREALIQAAKTGTQNIARNGKNAIRNVGIAKVNKWYIKTIQ